MAVLAFLAVAVSGCRGDESKIAHPESLQKLNRLVGERNNFGVILDAKTGKALAAFRVNNPIRAAIADGDGGWYVGGGFIRVDGHLRKRLAHIRADGTLDPEWRPEANGNGVSVTSLARIGSRLYVAGDFAQLNHRPRRHLGAFDIETGRLDVRWDPAENRPYWNNVLLASGNRLLVGGGGGQAESSLVALTPNTGSIDRDWRADVDGRGLEGGGVYVLAKTENLVFASGIFNRVGGVARSGAVALSARTGRLDKHWRAPRGPHEICPLCGSFYALAVGRNVLYASTNGAWEYDLVGVDPATGRVGGWRAALAPSGSFQPASYVPALAVAKSRVYVGGDFGRVQGVRRNGFAALDAHSAKVLPSWTPSAGRAFGGVLARSRSRLFLGLELSPLVVFDVSGLRTYRPVGELHVNLALSGSGSVHIGIGRRCNRAHWNQTGRCAGRVFRWLGTVEFSRAGHQRYDHGLTGIRSGRYFVRFVPRARGRPSQTPYDFPIVVP